MHHSTQRYIVEEGFLLFEVVAAVIIGVWLPHASAIWQEGLAFVFLMLLIVTLPLAKLRVEARLALDVDALQADLQFVASQKRLLAKMADSLADLLKDCTHAFKQTNDFWQTPRSAADGSALRLAQAIGLDAETKDIVKTLSKRTLDRMCDMLNYPEDVRAEDRDARATFFHFSSDIAGHRRLNRYVYSYPPALSPQTEEFDEVKDEKSAIIQCVKTQHMFVVADVPKAADEAYKRGTPGWKDMRAGHHLEYGSIVCYPVITGRRGDPTQRFVGVITVTVRTRGFFSEDGNSGLFREQFLTKFLHPFSILLGILSELERVGEIGETALQAARDQIVRLPSLGEAGPETPL